MTNQIEYGYDDAMRTADMIMEKVEDHGMPSDEIKDGFIHLLDQEPEKALSKCSNALKNDSESIYAWSCTQGALVKLERYSQVAKNYENYIFSLESEIF